MKYRILILLYFVFFASAFGQNSTSDYQSRFNEIVRLLQTKDYYSAMREMNLFLRKYPNDAGMFFNRGITEYFMNEMPAAKKDMLKAKALGIKGKDGILNYVCSTDYMVKLISESYIDKGVVLEEKNQYRPVYTRKDTLRGALRPERDCYDVTFYDLTMKVIPSSKSIEGCNKICFNTVLPTRSIQVDLTSNYTIQSVTLGGKSLTYHREFDALFIDLGEQIPAGTRQVLSVCYKGKPVIAPKPPWNGGFTWKKAKGKYWDGVSCEHLGASCWWPNKDHLSDKPDSMRMTFVVPKGYKAISNGTLRSEKPVDKKFTAFEWFVQYPINNYNVTFYLGNFISFADTIVNKAGKYPIDYYVLPQNLGKAKNYYKNTKEIVSVYEELYGVYPYMKDGMGMVEAPFAGMEHQGAIAIGDGYGEKNRGYNEKKDYDYLLVHETAHEWWGNTVTMRDMADAWISESFATYTESLFTERKYGYTDYVESISKNMMDIRNIWPMVGNHDVNENSFIGNDIYHKGAVMLNNLRCTLDNDSLFFGLVKTFYNENKYKILATDDFIKFVNAYTGKDYSIFLRKFLYETEPPVLIYHYKIVNGELVFTYRWTSVKKGFSMPFSIMINGEKNIRLVGTTEDQVFRIGDVQKFYLPNEKQFEKDKITKNSFTYFWTLLAGEY